MPALVFFRSPVPERSWVTAAGCILDTAAIYLAAVESRHGPRVPMCIRSGFISMRRIADYFGIAYDADPRPDDPISVSRREFDLVLTELHAAGLPLRSDREQMWRDFAGWRVNYDSVLIALTRLVDAPPALWSSDRPGAAFTPKLRLAFSMKRRRP
jgi:hypothetical protein